jgi:hypothetical protein
LKQNGLTCSSSLLVAPTAMVSAYLAGYLMGVVPVLPDEVTTIKPAS